MAQSALPHRSVARSGIELTLRARLGSDTKSCSLHPRRVYLYPSTSSITVTSKVPCVDRPSSWQALASIPACIGLLHSQPTPGCSASAGKHGTKSRRLEFVIHGSLLH